MNASETKHAIGALCQHLNFLLGTDLRPEHFRLAKFDKSDDKAVEVFWNLLGRFAREPTTLSTVHQVKLFLYHLNYQSLPFFCLPDDMTCGSRELLLAFGFLLARGALEALVQEHLRRATDFDMSTTIDARDIKFDVPNDKTKAMAWMDGKIKLNRRMINDLIAQNEKLLAKVNERVVIANVSELSYNEVVALKRRKYSEKFLRETEFVIGLLENHQRWINKQYIFWRWMNSVLAERAKASCERTYDFQCLENFSAIIKNNSN